MIILITGASRGIGASLAARFSIEGSNTVIAIARSHERLNELEKSLKKANPDADIHTKAVDLSNIEDTGNFTEWFRKHFSSLDILINNAGILVNKPFNDISREEAFGIFDVNYFAPAGLIQSLAGSLGMAEKPHVVNISSMGGFQGSVKFPGLSHYSASKAALASLTECLAVEYKETGISFNCLAIGSVSTEMLNEAFPGYKAPVGPEEMADFIYDFAVKGHYFMNGKIIPVALSTP